MSNPVLRSALNRGVREGQSAPAGYGQQPQQQPFMTDQQLQEIYNQPTATARQTGRMTYEDVVMKTASLFGILLVGAALGWFVPALAFPAMLVGLVLGLVNAFKKDPSPALIIAYAAFQGVFLGGISSFFEAAFPGIVVQAVLATLSVFAVMLVLFRMRIIRVTGKFQKFLILAVAGYAVFALVNFAFVMFTGSGGARSVVIDLPIVGAVQLGVIIGIVAVVLAALTLVMDFQMIEDGVRAGVPEKFAWLCAFSLMVTLIWLYVEILRLLSYFRGGD
ncbi:Bax inhibitor-1/YccA family protein [Sediminivirga luteola]|uniref:Bax inhibitor-1/YccA family protein n=1 Tax=Sediminivirga luteola TaxID=1774748 RepID=A0A8J2XL05_9MICO|nr:Bax inhibitor-1/YccA family protein [Sediminivirga luteola]MCI2265561.1 Bax inhibitor-1/YccA family protein [Sediminivirga luteola]GGA18764.1 hypothetical protein GCM10011333_22340 [Sediminivirga luteola]